MGGNGNNGNNDRLYFGGLQNHCRWWLQPWNSKMLASWNKSYDQPKQHIKKQRHYFPNKGLSSQSYGFSSNHVGMWELDYKESWVPKNWQLMLWDCGVGEDSWKSLWMQRANQSILKEISPNYSLEEQMLKLKLQYFGHLMRKTNSLEKTLTLGKIEGRRRRGRQRMRWSDGTTMRWTWVWAGSRRQWWTGKPGVLQSTGPQRIRHDWATEMNWTELNSHHHIYFHTNSQFPDLFISDIMDQKVSWYNNLATNWIKVYIWVLINSALWLQKVSESLEKS